MTTYSHVASLQFGNFQPVLDPNRVGPVKFISKTTEGEEFVSHQCSMIKVFRDGITDKFWLVSLKQQFHAGMPAVLANRHLLHITLPAFQRTYFINGISMEELEKIWIDGGDLRTGPIHFYYNA